MSEVLCLNNLQEMTTFGHTIEDDSRYKYGYEKANEKVAEKSLKKHVKINIFLDSERSEECIVFTMMFIF